MIKDIVFYGYKPNDISNLVEYKYSAICIKGNTLLVSGEVYLVWANTPNAFLNVLKELNNNAHYITTGDRWFYYPIH